MNFNLEKFVIGSVLIAILVLLVLTLFQPRDPDVSSSWSHHIPKLSHNKLVDFVPQSVGEIKDYMPV